ncbi:MAG: efflux RND transporter permease subunit [Verrucomicrobiota bacterium]
MKPHPIAAAFVTNKHLLVITIVVILVAGISAFQGLPRQEDPVITNRGAQIRTVFPGASAARVEALVTEPLEQKLKEVPAVKHIDSSSRAGISIVSVELIDGVTEESNDAIFSEMRDKMAEAADAFPSQVHPPVFDEKRIAVAFTSVTSLQWNDGSEQALSVLRRQAEDLADRLRAIPGTDIVQVFGAPMEEVGVEVDSDKVAALGLSTAQVAAALRGADSKNPAGSLRGSDRELLIEVTGELDSIQRVREVPLVTLPNGTQVRVGDVAEVSRTLQDPPDQIALRDGTRALFVAARTVPDLRVDLWARNANETLIEFQDGVGGGIRMDTVFDQETYTTRRLGELAGNLMLAAGVVLIVIILLMGWRASWIVSCALPLTGSLTLFIVALNGGELHQMSIFGMIIALGLLIDNAIVVTDEVRHHRKAGLTPLEAVSRTVRHLFVPLLASTLTTMLSFLPILLLPGNAGDFVGSIAGSVIIALGASFFVAMTVIAALAGLFGHRENSSPLPHWLREGVSPRAGNRFGRRLLLAAMKRPLLTVGMSLIIPVIGFLLAGTLGSQFFPRTDRNMFEVEITLGSDASIERTRALAEDVATLIREEPGVQTVDWLVGASFPTVYYNLIMTQDGSSNYAHGIVTTTDFDAVATMMDGLQARLDQRFPEAQILLTKFAQGPPADADVEFRLTGPDINTLQALGEEVRRQLVAHPGILHTLTSLPRGEPKLWLETNETKASLAGLSLATVAGQIEAAFEGSVGGSLLEDIEELPVRVREAGASRDQPKDLRHFNLTLPGPDSPVQWAPVSALSEIELRPEQAGITRRNGQRVNRILGFARPDVLAIDITEEVMANLDAGGFQLPPGYSLELGGEAENRNEAVGNLFLYLPVIIVLTIATLILTFRSVRMALILLLVAPLSAGFGLLATWAMQFPISFNTILGSIGLMGLTFNDNIVVLASLVKNARAAQGDPEAIVDAVLRCSRHLISTTLTTIGSFLPLLIFIGGQFWPPLAIVLAGGIGGSTLLAFTFTPAFFRLLSKRAKTDPALAGGAIPQPA